MYDTKSKNKKKTMKKIKKHPLNTTTTVHSRTNNNLYSKISRTAGRERGYHKKESVSNTKNKQKK